MKQIVVFAGTRPEIIKMAPVVRELKSRAANSRQRWKVHFCFSGQHLEIALPFLEFFEIEPDSTLELMSPGQSLGQLTARGATQLDSFFERTPGCVAALVQGDTTTAFVAALSAFYHGIPVGHVEAGLRTSSISQPFPEELNRRLIGRIATWHYAPTKKASETLRSEKVAQDAVLITGNTGIDSLLWTAARGWEPRDGALRNLEGKRIALVTVHRRENIGAPLENIAQALRRLAQSFGDVQFILPVHPNPKVSEIVRCNLSGLPNFHLTPPLEYGDLVWAMKQAELILSDSGGIQEEAPSLSKPVIVLRDETERPEAIEYGTSILVGSNANAIFTTASEFLGKKRRIEPTGKSNPYGDGFANHKIADHLLNVLNLD
ncbi:MAG: UDP-N-acetylglucosamine 2-epimerase (non-hydrolyzing) [Bdellovibrionota bacterium]